MTWKTHMLGGLQAGIIMASVTNAEPTTAMVEIGAAALGSILPDIDYPGSKISRSDILLKMTSTGLSNITKHRREVHTVWASFLFAVMAFIFMKLSTLAAVTGVSFILGVLIAIAADAAGAYIGSLLGVCVFFALPQFLHTSAQIDSSLVLPFAVAIFLGCISHLVYDSANVQGIMWLHPFKKKRYHFLNIQTTSKEEDYFFFAMLILTILLAVVLRPMESFQFSKVIEPALNSRFQ